MNAGPWPRAAGPRIESRHAAWLFALAGLVFFVLRATDWFRAVPGDLGDARFNSVILEHLYQWVTGGARSLWSPTFFYPAPGVLAFSDNHFGSGIVYVLLRLVGLGRETAFDGWFAVGCMLNFVAMYTVARQLGFAGLGSAVAAFVFAFCLPALAQEGHAQLTYRFAVPLAWLALVQFVRERRWARLSSLAFWTSVQFFLSIYLGVFTVYLLAATAAAMLLPALRPGRDGRRAAQADSPLRASAIVALCAIATGALLYKYHAISKGYGFSRTPDEVFSMLPRLQSYLLADRSDLYGWIGRQLAEVPMRHEQQMFMGAVPIALGLCGLWGPWGAQTDKCRLAWLCLLALMLLIAGTLQVEGQSLYQVAMGLPGASSIRAVSRIGLVMALPVAIMAAAGVERLASVGMPQWALSALVVAALSLETLSYAPTRAPIAQWQERIAPIAAAAKRQPLPADAVLHVTGRSAEPSFLAELDGMIVAQDLKLPTLNGYSGNAPQGFMHAAPCVSPVMRVSSIAPWMLARRGLSREALLARTLWLPAEPCTQPHPPTGMAVAPITQAEARGIELDATLVSEDARELKLKVRLRNTGSATLHTLSGIGQPIRLSWRFVREADADPSATPGLPSPGRLSSGPPGWDARQDLYTSLPPGESLDFELTTPRPEAPGPYDLQLSLVAEGYRWLHDLGMPIAHVRVPVTGEPKASER